MAEKRKKKQAEEPGVPGWMVTYGDLMSLLLTFFVLLLSFSSINEEQFKEALMSLQGALGVLPKNVSFLHEVIPRKERRQTPKEVEDAARELQRELQVRGDEDKMQLEYDNETGGLKITLPGNVLFDSGSDQLRAEGLGLLDEIASVLSGIPEAFVEVRGHTDAIPLGIGSRFADNWDLSYHRAKSVMLHMQTSGGLGTTEFESVACGPVQPVATNDTEEGRQKNRRVELLIRGSFSEAVKGDLRERLGGTSSETPRRSTQPAAPPMTDTDFGTNTRFVR